MKDIGMHESAELEYDQQSEDVEEEQGAAIDRDMDGHEEEIEQERAERSKTFRLLASHANPLNDINPLSSRELEALYSDETLNKRMEE